MYASASQGINAYNKVGVETAVAAADPHKLILMLYEGAILAVNDAKRHMQSHDIGAKGSAVSKAIQIIDSGLRASLDVKAGGELGERLEALYRYMNARLFHANLRNDVKALDEVAHLLADLHGAWVAIGKRETATEQTPQPRAATSYGKA